VNITTNRNTSRFLASPEAPHGSAEAVGTTDPRQSTNFRDILPTQKKRTNKQIRGDTKNQKAVLITSPEFTAAVKIEADYRDVRFVR
jgi:hypothetical protein